MGIKETWQASYSLFRKSLPQIWPLGVMLGVTITTSLLIYAISQTLAAGFRIIGIIVPLVISLSFVYLSSLTLLKIYNINKGQDTSWGNLVAFVNKRYIRIIITMAIIFIIKSIGEFLLVLPGIFAFVLFSMSQPLVLLDDKGVMASLKDSCKLVWGRWWHTFAIIVPLILTDYWTGYSMKYAITHKDWYMILFTIIIFMLFYPILYSFILTIFDDLKAKKLGIG